MIHLPNPFCFLIIFCFYEKLLPIFLGFTLMDCAKTVKLLTHNSDFGFGFLLFGCFSKLFNVLALLLMFLLGFKVFQCKGWNYKGLAQYIGEFRGDSNGWRNGFCLKSCNDGEFDDTRKCGTREMLKRASNIANLDHPLEETDEIEDSNGIFNRRKVDYNVFGEEKEYCDEDKVFDIMSLREMVKCQRKWMNLSYRELEKERMAAESAANEAMAMILRLQNEKGSLQLQVNQLQRYVDEMQVHDQEVIQSLQWMIMKHENERSLSEEQLRLCREKLKIYMKGDHDDDTLIGSC